MRYENHPDIAPAMRNSHEKNHDFLAQDLLMSRDPSGGRDWAERYAAKFRELYIKEDAFRDLVNGELNAESLARIQELLNGAG